LQTSKSKIKREDFDRSASQNSQTQAQNDRLAPATEVVALGVDGLYFQKGKLIGIQNGTSPQRVVRFSLSRDNLRLTRAETLEANHADFNEPTLGVLAGEDFYFVANSQWEMVDEKGAASAAEKWREPVVLRLRL
jgi:hypothetical protein